MAQPPPAVRHPSALRTVQPVHDRRSVLAQASYTALHLLPEAEAQARRGEPRLLAEIFRFLRPQPLIIHTPDR